MESVTDEEPPRRRHTAAIATFVVLVAALAGGYLYTQRSDTFVPLPMTHNMPTTKCRSVTLEEIEALNRNAHWLHTVRSMEWHMRANQLEGISAFHMGDPTCFILVSLNGGATALPMYNTVVRGYSSGAIVARNEESLACPGVIRNMLRAVRVRVSYIDGNTRSEMVELFTDAEAFAVQHVHFYSLGRTICDLHASNADKGIATLRDVLAADTAL